MPKICDMDCFNCKFDDCINDYIPPKKVYTEEQKEGRREATRRMYQKYKEQKRCVNCGRPALKNQVRCLECKLKQNKRNHERLQEKAFSRNFLGNEACYFCGEKRVKGQKVCQKHLEICRKNAERATQSKAFKLAHQRQKDKIWAEIKTEVRKK